MYIMTRAYVQGFVYLGSRASGLILRIFRA